MFEQLRQSVASFLAPKPTRATKPKSRRMYAGARLDRLTADWVAGSTSADSEVVTSLRVLRNRARELERDNDYAKQVVRLFKNNIAGRGIGFQAQVKMRRGDKLDVTTNDLIEAAWAKWCRKEFCSTSGRYSFSQILRLVCAAMPTSGEILIRKVRNRSFGGGTVPYALEVIESDRLVDTMTTGHADNGNLVKMGVEMDEWGRPVAYWLYPYHPGDFNFAGQPQTNRYERVPASEVIHLYLHDDRPGQTRGVPGFHTALRRLNNMGGYEEAEIIAARASACIMGFIKSADDEGAGEDDVEDGERVTTMAPAEIRELEPGEEFQGFAPNRPNTGLEPFMRFMLRGMAAGVGVSYESVSRDYSQSNYSSSRLAIQDDRDAWQVFQDWLITDLCQPVFEEWLDMAVLSGALNLPGYASATEAFRACRWMPRGWSYIDPLKEVMADRMRVRAGFAPMADIIAAQGGDWEDVFDQRKREVDEAKRLGLIFETDAALVNDKGQIQPDTVAQDATGGATDSSGSDGSDGSDGSGDASRAKDSSNAKAALPLLYTTLERAIDGDHLTLAAKVLDRIDDIERKTRAA